MKLNSKGEIYYGMHFYPGVAEYREPGKDPYRIFLNEDTIRAMGPTFQGKPVFVEHVHGVEEDIDELRGQADGWVMESFYNAADGKHWVKFIIVSKRGKRAIENGMRLSNAYLPLTFAGGSEWNGVSYVKEVTAGEYEHLALVQNPRYEESVVMTPERFKAYNEEKLVELKRLANSKEGEPKMKLNLFKRQKVENALDFEATSVVLPKSGKEMTLIKMVEEMDVIANMHGYANGDHLVKVGEDEMSVNDLVKKHIEMCNAMVEKEKNETELATKDVDVEASSDKKNEEDKEADKKDKKENEEADKEDDKKKENEEDDEDKKMNAASKKKIEDEKKAEAKKKADAIRNAHLKDVSADQTVVIESMSEQVARGKARYGSK